MNLDRRLLRLAAENRFLLLITIGAGLAAGVLAVIQARGLSRVIAQVFLEQRSLEDVSRLLAALLGVILLRAVLTWGSEICANAIARRVKGNLRERLFRRILEAGPIQAQGERTGELTSVLVEGVESLDAYFSQYLPQLALAVLVPFIFLAFVFPLDWLSGLVLLVTAPLIPLFMVLIGNLAQALTRRQWQTLSRMSAYFLDVLQGLTTLKMLGRSRAQGRVIEQVSERYRQVTMSVLRVTFLSALALELVSTLSTAVVAVEVGLRLLYGHLDFEQAFFVLVLAPEFYLPLRLLGTRFHAGMSGVAAAKRIFEILERPAEDASLAQDASLALSMTGRGEDICFEDVHFSYEGGRQALNGVTLRILAGKTTALVGLTGAGKSTLAALLLRFIEPEQGRIMVGGTSLGDLPAADWRAKIAWVSQNPFLMHDSIAANIRLARPEASLEDVMQAARQAHAHDFIIGLPQAYDTVIGERGARLSGGQVQRIALARAFLKDAPIVIMDEATANLDPEHEARLQESFGRLLEGRTAVLIAHRLNTVVQADQIVVLEAGKVAQSGVHADLVDQPGPYRRLVQAALSTTSGDVVSGREGRPMSGDVDSGGKGISTSGDVDSKKQSGQDSSWLPVSPALVSAAALPSTLAPLLRLLRLAAPFAGLMALSVLVGFATVGSSIGLMTTSAYILSMAALHPSIAELQVAIVGVRFFGIARGVFRYLERYFSHQVTFHLLARWRTWFYQALEPLAPARLLRYHSGDLLARVLNDIQTLENFYVRALAPPLTALLVSLAAAAFLARFHLSLAVALLGILILAGVCLPWIVRVLSREAGRQMVLQRAALSSAVVEGVQGMADLMAFNQEIRQFERVRGYSQALGAAQKRLAFLSGLQSASSGFLAHLGMWAVLALAIPLVTAGQIEGVYLAGLVLAALTSFEAVAPLPQAAQHLESDLQAAGRLFELVDAQPEITQPPAHLPSPQRFDLEVEDLRFRYPCTADDARQPAAAQSLGWTLDGLSFSLPQGKRLAVVGPSGAGKSTLIHLLLRFWEYQQGQVRLDGRDLREYAPEDVRGCFGVVAQNAYLFSASVGDNLRIARPEASRAEIVRAAEGAQIHDFIQSLPEGYDTWIGEQGLRLSAGQRQRLAIARALLQNAPVLILDEPTANLDALTEREVLQALQTLMEGRSTLLVTHRLVGLDAMEEILVMEEGRIVERGSHANLLEAEGIYRRMWDLQRQWLGDEV